VAETGFVDVVGGKLYCETEGDGHSLLLIHGGLGDSRMWDGQVPAFAERYRVIRYDTRGFGRSETDDVEFTEHGDAAAVLQHFGVASAYVVGQSRGGSIALDLALDRPQLVDALVSVAGGVSGYEPPEGVERPPWEEMEHLWNAKEFAALAELETQVWVDGWGQPQDRVDPELRRKVLDWIRTGYAKNLTEGKPQPLSPPAAQRLDEVRVPLLVLIGLADEPGLNLGLEHLASSVAGARVVRFADVAHMIQLEQPERFNRLVLEFLG
jgi:3-oxoadipate enol-lactonase